MNIHLMAQSRKPQKKAQNSAFLLTKRLTLDYKTIIISVSKGEHMTLKELRIKKRLTQDEFAQSIGVTKMTVSRWERGVMKLSLKNIRKIEETHKVKL